MNRRKHVLCAAALALLTRATVRAFPWCQLRFLTHALNTSAGRGYGARGFSRASFVQQQPRPVWATLQAHGSDALCRSHTRMSLHEFAALLDSLAPLRDQLNVWATALRFENKVLLLFMWLVRYPHYATLAYLFGTSPPVISQLIDRALPLLAAHFARLLPDRRLLKSELPAVVDATLHASSAHGDLSWHASARQHGMVTHLMVDSQGRIAAFVTGVRAALLDSEAASYFDSFQRALGGGVCARGDAQYDDVPYVQADEAPAQEHPLMRAALDFIGQCRTLSPRHRFVHSADKHVRCVFVVCGWYNWLRARDAQQ